MRILHLTLYRKWFDAIATGIKPYEYRRNTEFWRRRLLNPDLTPRAFDEVHFRNGYNPGLPFMRAEWKGLSIRLARGENFFVIRLGKVLEIKNWEGPKA